MVESDFKLPGAVPGQWDSNLNSVRVEGNLVRSVRCGVTTPNDLEDGDVYYKVVGAIFIDEEQARGRHTISVDVVDENMNRVQGARVWHGWPTHRLPQFDERVQLTVYGSQLAEWGLYSGFDAWRVPGPYWVSCADGKSDVFWGAGLPWNRHVCFSVVFQRMVYHAEIDGTLDEVLLIKGEQNQVIQFNPTAALQRRIFADGFVPNSAEFDVTHEGTDYIAQRAEHLQSGEVRIYYAPKTNYNQVAFVARL